MAWKTGDSSSTPPSPSPADAAPPSTPAEPEAQPAALVAVQEPPAASPDVPLTAQGIDSIFAALCGVVTTGRELLTFARTSDGPLAWTLTPPPRTREAVAARIRGEFGQLLADFNQSADILAKTWKDNPQFVLADSSERKWCGLSAASTPAWVVQWCGHLRQYTDSIRQFEELWEPVLLVLDSQPMPPFEEIEAALERTYHVVRANAIAAQEAMKKPASPSTPRSSKPNGRMSVQDAGVEARRLADEMGEKFTKTTERKQAQLIGCSWETWSKTQLYRELYGKKPARTPGKGKSPPSLSMTPKVEAALVDGEKDEVLKQLVAEQEAEALKDARKTPSVSRRL